MNVLHQKLFAQFSQWYFIRVFWTVIFSGVFFLFLSLQAYGQNEVKDSLVQAEADGSLLLSAEKGKAVGAKIKYMPEWRAFGWFTAADRVEWDVNVSKAGKYDVYLEWSVSDESAGTPYIFETLGKSLKGKVKKTGSWETFKTRKIGRIPLAQGKQKMVFRGNSDNGKDGLLDLRNIRLVPVK